MPPDVEQALEAMKSPSPPPDAPAAPRPASRRRPSNNDSTLSMELRMPDIAAKKTIGARINPKTAGRLGILAYQNKFSKQGLQTQDELVELAIEMMLDLSTDELERRQREKMLATVAAA